MNSPVGREIARMALDFYRQLTRLRWVTLGLLLAITMAGCTYKIEEKLRLSNESKDIDAVLAIKLTDATVATPTEVFVLPKGEIPKGEPVFRADHVSGESIAWISDSELLIKASRARIFRQEMAIDLDFSSGKKTVTIRYEIDKIEDK